MMEVSMVESSINSTTKEISIHEGYDLIKEVYLHLDDGDQQFLRRYDLTPVQFYALLWLDGVPRKSLSQLSRDLLCDRSNMTRVADTLERKGLVTRQRDSDDRRVTWLILTPRGAELCREARREHTHYTHARMSALSAAEQSQLEQLLLKLRTGLAQQPAA
jgi:DNA-binding MarR family transcriptional regulator